MAMTFRGENPINKTFSRNHPKTQPQSTSDSQAKHSTQLLWNGVTDGAFILLDCKTLVAQPKLETENVFQRANWRLF
jgi:hypothetical protein